MAEFKKELVAGNTKAAMKDAGATSRDLWMVERKKLKVLDGFNVRDLATPENKAHIQQLAASMLAEGFYQDKPLAGFVAQEGKKQIIYVTDGHCRLAAVDLAVKQGAEIERIPVVVKPQGTNPEDLAVALVRSNSGKPLSPYEIGLVCKRLVSYGMEVPGVAERLGYTPKYVTDLLALVGAPKKLRDMVSTGTVAATTAIEAIHAYGDAAVEKLTKAKEAAAARGKNRATRRDVETEPGMKRTKVSFAFKKGERTTLGKIEPIRKLGGADWWKAEGGQDVAITDDIIITVYVLRSPPAASGADELV